MAEIGQIYYLVAESHDETVKHPYVIVKKLTQKEKDTTSCFLACMITTNAKKAAWPYTIPLDPGEGGMERQSYIMSFKTIEVKETELAKYLGAVDYSKVEELLLNIHNCQKRTGWHIK